MPAPSPALFLIDGNSLVYRAFFALPESIATSSGEPTNAIFGFASMLVKLITEYGVTPTIVAWDAGTSGRTETYPEYKAQRAPAPGPAARAVARVRAAGRGVRLPQRAAGGLRGRRRDRHDALAGDRRAGGGLDRHRRPRRLPAGSTRRGSSR